MGPPQLSRGFGVNILTAITTMGFRVDVLPTPGFTRKRQSMFPVNWEGSLPNTPDAGVDHNNIRVWRIIDDGLIKLYGMRVRLGLFNTRLLGVGLPSIRIREGLMNKKILTNNELRGILYHLRHRVQVI